MTLTELRYIVAVAKQKHFGRAAEACFVSQPTLSVAVRKLEDELGIQLFERGNNEITVTALGLPIITQAQYVLEQAQEIRELALHHKNPLQGHLRLGVIYTIGPYLLPFLIPAMIEKQSQMPLLLEESFTVRLLEQLRQGEIDCAILAEPFNDSGLITEFLYQEPFVVAIPKNHHWNNRETIHSNELQHETMLLLGHGHCFRDHVLEVCPELSRFSQNAHGLQKTFEGSSLETIRHMVSSGIGITVLPRTAINDLSNQNGLLTYIPFATPEPSRKIVLAYRKSFPRIAAIQSLKNTIESLSLPGINKTL